MNKNPVALSPVTVSENPVMVTVTSWFVNPVVENSADAVGAILSIRVTVAVVCQVFPAKSSKVNVNDQVFVNV